jgi:O-antigen ligase
MKSELSRRNKVIRAFNRPAGVLLRPWVEYAYYSLLFYAVMGEAWGLSVPLLGAGGMAVLAMYSIWRLRNAISIYKPIVLPLGCALSFLIIQIAIHGVSLTDDNNRPFVNWIFALIVIQSLSTRHRFLHRFALALLAIEVCLLPYLSFHEALNAPDRAALEQGIALSNPNNLAAWFGFCTVYFAITGLESKRIVIRSGAWVLAVGSLSMVALTVSRGPIAAVLIAVIVALQHVLKRGFGPILALAVVASVAYESGLLEQRIAAFAERGTEESGREVLWPQAIERFIDAPLQGAGSSAVQFVGNHDINPHNSFLFIAVGSGVVPLAFLLAFWISAIRAGFIAKRQGAADAPFFIPLLVFVSIELMVIDGVFTQPWCIVTSLLPLHAINVRRMRYARARQLRRNNAAEHAGPRGSTGYSRARYQLGSELPKG